MNTPLHEAARVSGGKIARIHHNACPSLADQPGPCNCGEPSYRLIITSKRLASRLIITSKAVRR